MTCSRSVLFNTDQQTSYSRLRRRIVSSEAFKLLYYTQNCDLLHQRDCYFVLLLMLSGVFLLGY